MPEMHFLKTLIFPGTFFQSYKIEESFSVFLI